MLTHLLLSPHLTSINPSALSVPVRRLLLHFSPLLFFLYSHWTDYFHILPSHIPHAPPPPWPKHHRGESTTHTHATHPLNPGLPSPPNKNLHTPSQLPNTQVASQSASLVTRAHDSSRCPCCCCWCCCFAAVTAYRCEQHMRFSRLLRIRFQRTTSSTWYL